MLLNKLNMEEENKRLTTNFPIEIRKSDEVEDIKCENEEEGLIPPDGGWGWLVVMGSLTILTLTSLLVPSYGIIFSSLFNEHKTSSTTVSWIFNMNQFIWNVTGLFVGPLSDHLGMRKLAFIGGVLISTSIIVSGFVAEPEYLFIVFSFFTGIGQGLSVMVSLTVVPYYFTKKKGLAIGISMTGICAGQFVGPFLVTLLLEQYGYRGMTLILGAILMNISLTSMLFHPVEWHLKKRGQNEKLIIKKEVMMLLPENKYSINDPNEIKPVNRFSTTDSSMNSLKEISDSKTKNNEPETMPKNKQQITKQQSLIKQMFLIFRSIYCNILLWLKYHRVKIITLAPTLIITSYTNYLMMVPFAMTEAGYTIHEVSWTLTVTGLSNFLSRFFIAILTDFLPCSTKYHFMAGSLVLCISMYAFTLVTKMGHILFIMGVFGAGAGTCISLMSLVILEFMGLKYLPQVLGLDFFLMAFMFVIIGPILGAIRDATGDYSYFFRLLGFGPLLVFMLWLLMPCAISSDRKKEQNKAGNNMHIRYLNDEQK